MALLHATCIAIDGAGVLLRGPSGAGKSDLALRLIDEGAMLVSDDYCEIGAIDGALVATAPKTIAGKLEIRGQGIIELPAVANAIIALVADLMPAHDIPRLPETTSCIVEGISLPWLCIDPTAASASARMRLAARMAIRKARP